MDASGYVLDASVFIEAARGYYAFDIAPRFWKSLVEQAEDEQMESIDRVKQELDRAKDELAVWANGDFDEFFVSTDEEDVVEAYGEIMNWVQAQGQFSDAAKSEFAAGADGWLVAHAKENGLVVATQEKLNPEVKRRIPIPNVCQAFGVPFTGTFEMMRELGVRWTR